MKVNIYKIRMMILVFSVMFSLVVIICMLKLAGKGNNRIHPEGGVLNLKNWVLNQSDVLSLTENGILLESLYVL